MFLLVGLALGKDDLVHKEEDHHGDAAVEDDRADVVDKRGDKQPGHCHPDAVDGVDNAGNDAEGDHIPHNLIGQVALAAEDQVALEGEVDALAHHHGHHVGAEVGQATVVHVIAQDVPLEGLTKQGDRDARPAEIHHRQPGKGRGQEGQQNVLKDSDHIADNDKQSALPNPLGRGGMVGRKTIPKTHSCLLLSLTAFRLAKKPPMVLPAPRKKWPLQMSRMEAAISMVTMPPVILARARKGIF